MSGEHKIPRGAANRIHCERKAGVPCTCGSADGSSVASADRSSMASCSSGAACSTSTATPGASADCLSSGALPESVASPDCLAPSVSIASDAKPVLDQIHRRPPLAFQARCRVVAPLKVRPQHLET
eukprot:3974103-Karenia_brevis.AAC.1